VLNTGLSLLGGEFSERIVHLDPWRKMLVGWTEPRIFTTGAPGEAKLVAQLRQSLRHRRHQQRRLRSVRTV
jgi:hypothetical protein